ncbi:hypothetical protein BDV95DRAFT_617753 [Massariosphaeria phaeospora]|uniref:Uncharacterized protein n=1 Tax=Massariosphaeria phaeospora TaxID=100035 RepID=A0A7C8I818_9PLEO|nr:hypothetical protein BDV95DRAFT_617753 [Massariosphaeria phaeospora]
MTSLRLCHRFGQGKLSKLSQELLEQIVDEFQRLAKTTVAPEWENEFTCFQGRCNLGDHWQPYGPHTEWMWNLLFCNAGKGFYQNDCPGDLDPAKFSEEDKARMLLKSHFGLEAIILHERLSPQLARFLPETGRHYDYESYYTLCYLALAADSKKQDVTSEPKDSQLHELFAPQEDHNAYRRVIAPSSLDLSERQRSRFARAMRILDLKPHYHLSELEPHVQQPIKDTVLLDMCSCKLNACPSKDCGTSPTDASIQAQARKLNQYISRKNKELSTQTWPQLTMLAASDVIFPDGWH